MTEPDLSLAAWRRSSRSGSGGNCVEVAAVMGAMAVRDSKNPDGPKLILGRAGWHSFLRDAKHGCFDLA